MEEAKINIEETKKTRGRAKNGDKAVEEIKEEVEEIPQDNIEPIQENEDIKKEEIKEVKKYRVLIGILGKTRQGGEIELTDEEAAEFLKEEYIEEV